MRILVADAFAGVDALRAGGHDVTDAPATGPDELPERLAGVEVLVVRSTPVPAAAIAAGDELQLVVRAGSGTDTIDVASAADRGVVVCNTPGRNATAVAELALGLLVALDRRIPDNVIDLRSGRWDKARYRHARGLAGRSLGIIGCGAVGLAFAARAIACELHVRALDRPGRDAPTRRRLAELGIELVPDLPTLLSSVDVVSLHVPATPDTEGMVDAAFLDHLRPGAWLINTARGELVDEAALLAAIEAKDLRAGLDVYRDEPAGKVGTFDHALARHPNVVGTHHIGASTEQAQAAIAAAVVEVIEAFGRGEILNRVAPDGGEA